MTSVFLVAICLFVQAPPPELVQSIEQQRGGRHWIDQPTNPPKSPDESAACFEIEPGFRIELVAAEPLVFDPVAIDFDHRGRMFVAEYTDYPVGPADPSAPPLSKIVLLDDTDADGRMDKRTVFADQIRFCHSVMAFRDGVLTCSDTEILYVADTNGDDIADVREVWFDGFIPAHPQMQIGCPRYGFDNWIYLTYGHGKVRCTRPGFESEAIDIPRVDFRFHPETMQFEAVSGAGQFGHTIDNFGHRFFSSNRNPIMTDILTLEQVQRNPLAGVSVGHMDVGPSGEKTRVFPKVAMKSNWLSHAGTHTSACGVTAYRGGAFGPDSDHMVFVCEPVGHLVTRSLIDPMGAGLAARRAREGADFLTSTDTWFRPASLATGPDGALYLADMYRLWVEHPKFVPDDVAAKMDWRAGEDRGRIWRVTRGDASVTAFRPPESTADLIASLSDTNGWSRMLAQRLLVERRDEDLTDELRSVIHGQGARRPNESRQISGQEFATLHALWVLAGSNRLEPDDLIAASQHVRPVIRRDVARLARPGFSDNDGVQSRLTQLCLDSNPEVRFHALLAIDPKSEAARSAVIDAALLGLNDRWWQNAMLIAAPDFSVDVARTILLQSESSDSHLSARVIDFLERLAVNAAASEDARQFTGLMTLIAEDSRLQPAAQSALIRGLADGLPRNQRSDRPRSLNELLKAPPVNLAASMAVVGEILTGAARTAVDRSRPEPDRIAAMQLMQHLPPETLSSSLETLLQAGESADCQREALEAARRSGRAELAQSVVAAWDGIHPLARSAAIDLALLRPDSTRSLLDAMTVGTIPSSVISIDQRLALVQHPDEALRTMAAGLFGGAVSANRKEVADQYAAALDLAGDAKRGAAIFEKTCSKCHRINGVGHNVGPDITDTRARARDALLYDILDPNRRVDPQYSECIVVTTDGRLFNGLLISDTADSITLRQPEGRETILPRSEIEDLKTSSKSLMPEGIEKDVTVEQMADILAFLKDR